MVEPGMPSNYYQLVGRRIAICRAKAGLSQQAFGDRMRLSKASVINMELGVTGIRLDRAHLIAKICGVSVNDLVRGTA